MEKQNKTKQSYRKTGIYLKNTLPPLPSVIASISARAPMAQRVRLCPACPTAARPQQKMAHVCNSIGTWQGLLLPPGKRLMCSQAFGVFFCAAWVSGASGPSQGILGRSQAVRCARVPEQLGLLGLCARDTGVREAREKDQKKKEKSSLQNHFIGMI